MSERTLLCWGTVEGAALPDLVTVAGRAGFDGISVAPWMYFAARAAGHTDSDLRTLLADNGVEVSMIDPLITGLPGIPAPEEVGARFRATFEHGEDDCYRVAEALGARAINLAHYLGSPTEVSLLVDAIGAIASRAATRGVEVLVEFMPDGSIPDLETAARIVADAGGANCGVMFDTWHHWRGGGALEPLRQLPRNTVRALQLSDALGDVRGSGASPPTRDRLLPGEGLVSLREIVEIARASHADLVIGVEVFNRRFAELPQQLRADRAAATLHPLLAPPT